MRTVFAALVAVVLAASFVNATVHLETVFTIPLPASQSEQETAITLGNDMYFTVGTGGKLFAVNLTSKTVAWTSEFEGGFITQMGEFNGVLIVQGTSTTLALSTKDGSLMWVSSGWSLAPNPKNNRVMGNTLVIVSATNFAVVDLTTGATTKTIETEGGGVAGDQAFLLELDINSFVNNIEVYNLTTVTKQYELRNVANYLAASTKYLVITNMSGTTFENIVTVFDAATGAKKYDISDVGGIDSNIQLFTPIISGDKMYALIGQIQTRLVQFDLANNGHKDWHIDFSNTNPSASSSITPIGDSLLILSGLTVSVHNSSTGALVKKIENVPSNQEATVDVLAGSVITIPNLQGFTAWDIATGTMLIQNEHAPGAGAGISWKDGITVQTKGASVVGTKLSQ